MPQERPLRGWKAGDLASEHPLVPVDTPAAQVARVLAAADVRAVLVVRLDGSLAGVVSDRLLLRELLPSYVLENESLAGVLDQRSVDLCWRQLEGRTAKDLLPDEHEVRAEVTVDDTIMEVASVMVRSRSPLVAVRDQSGIVGAISIDVVISELLSVP